MPGGDAPHVQAPRRVDRRYLLFAVLLAGGLCAASFVKSDWTSNDFERFDGLRLTFLFFGLLGRACFAYGWMWLEPPCLSSATVLAVAAVAIGALLASFPVGSKDVFLYSAFGKVWRSYHANPYVVAPGAFVSDPWQPYLQVVWAKQPTPYGPLFVWESRLVDALAAGNLLAAVWVYKAVGAAALVGAILIGVQLTAVGDEGERAYRAALLACGIPCCCSSVPEMATTTPSSCSSCSARSGCTRGAG